MKKSVFLLTLSAAILCGQELTTDEEMPTVDSLLVEQEYSEDTSTYVDGSETDTSSEFSDETDDSDEPAKTGYSTFRFTLGGSLFDLIDMNSALAQYGNPTLDNGVVQFGFGKTSQKTKIVKDYGLTIHSWRNAINPTKKSDITAVDFSLTYGFDIIKAPTVSLFPYVGADAGVLLLKMSHRGLPFGDIALGNVEEDQLLHRVNANVHGGLGFDIRKKRDGFAPSIGFRTGYRFDLTNPTNWKRNWSTVDFGPELATTSFYAKLVFGIALPR